MRPARSREGARRRWVTQPTYNYAEWLQYITDHFLKPWGFKLTGRVKWQGERATDRGVLVAVGGTVTAISERSDETEEADE